ncbi:hypothetical protein BC835DRAFT_1305900 [Cytidiella melzeri]|nr:hypothetical protein BC835DRAFT_1305900 [Cytidiella melzeri]
MSKIPQSLHSEAFTFEADVAPILPPFISGSAEVQKDCSMDCSVHSVLAAAASPLESGSPTTDTPRTDGAVKSLQARFLNVALNLVDDKYSKTVKQGKLYPVTLDISEIMERLAALEAQVKTAKVALAKHPSEHKKELSTHYEQLNKQLGLILRKLSLYAPKLSGVEDNIEAVTSLCEDTLRISQRMLEGLCDVHEELPTSELQQSSAGADVPKNRKGLYPPLLARDSLPKRHYSLESIDRAFPKIDYSRVASPALPDSPATGTLHGDLWALAWEFPRPWQPQALTMQGISGADGGECKGESNNNWEREGGTAMREGGTLRTEIRSNKEAGVTDGQEDGETEGEQRHAKEDERKGNLELTNSRVKIPPTATKPSVGEVLEMLFPELAQGVPIYTQDLQAYTIIMAESLLRLTLVVQLPHPDLIQLLWTYAYLKMQPWLWVFLGGMPAYASFIGSPFARLPPSWPS